MEPNQDEHLKQPDIVKCELALEGAISRDYLNNVAMLVDDEELELQEIQAGPNPLRCSDHFATNGIHGCSLCKGWFWRKNLTKFYIMLNACIICRFMVFEVVDICNFI